MIEVRDGIHGSIPIHPHELPIIESRYFQRLRQIKQLGFSEYSFPNATHNRYTHSLGTMHITGQVWDAILGQTPFQISLARFRPLVRLAGLLHDVGHGPLSHTTEFAMPEVSDLDPTGKILTQRRDQKATHEDYTLKIILDSSLSPLIEKAGLSQTSRFKPIHVAALIDPGIQIEDDFFYEKGIHFRPILQQLISSEIDADRMDYLRRDSLFAGVSYGQFDFSWLVSNLTFHVTQGQCYLALQHRALYTFEDFLISRFHMFSMVYFHHKSVIYDEILARYLHSPDCNYFIPTDIEAYCDYHDAHLFEHLTHSSNAWARRIVEKKPYPLLIELHSGIPATPSAQKEQERLLIQTQNQLREQKIDFITSKSTSELSKYFKNILTESPEIHSTVDPIFVRYDNHYSPVTFIPLHECTDLFHRYQEKRSITRLYASTNTST